MQKIQLIEDDEAFRKALARALKAHGFSVMEAGSGKSGVAQVRHEPPDLVILDMVLPGMDGLGVCQALKQDETTSDIPILILTGNDRQGQEIVCLDMGADDYLLKPARTERVLAHCRALLRRGRAGKKPGRGRLELGALAFDYDRKAVVFKGKEFRNLTPKEFELLFRLAEISPKPMDRTALYQEIWGMEPPSEGSLKTVDVHVRRIRLKLGWRSDAWLVHVSGRGYCLAV